MSQLRLGLVFVMALALGGCVVGTVVRTAASVTGTVVSTTADVTGSVVSGTARAVTGGSHHDDDKGDKDKKKDE